MRCRKCGQKAAINMRQHRLSLCSEHFSSWLIDYTQHQIEKFQMFSRQERVLVAVSGGKDSLSLWDMLWKLGYQTEGLYIDLGIDTGIPYSAQSRICAQSFAEARELPLLIYDLKRMHRKNIPELTEQNQLGVGKPCSICGLVKRYIMNRVALEGDFDALATAHNLDDEAAILLSNTLDWSLEHLARGQPVMPAGGGFVRKVKPFCKTSERESAAYALLRGIHYYDEECPYVKNNKQLFFKQYLNEWEEDTPGIKLRFFNNYLKAIQAGAFPNGQESPEALARQQCVNCGQPTSAQDLCAFCRTMTYKPKG